MPSRVPASPLLGNDRIPRSSQAAEFLEGLAYLDQNGSLVRWKTSPPTKPSPAKRIAIAQRVG